MKKVSIFVLFSFFYCPNIIMAQTDCKQDSMYLAAYNYIVNDSINYGKLMTVSDSIVDLDRFWFSSSLEDFPIERKIVSQYRASKNYIWFDTFYSPYLTSLFCTRNRLSKNILFFSTIEDNILRADLLSLKKQVNMFDYNKMAFQNEGYIYLFIFNADTTIKLVRRNEIIYD